MEYSPPPLFKQGASARVKVVFFSLVAIMILVIDARLQTLNLAREVIGTTLYPLQVVALMPRNVIDSVAGYFTRLSSLEQQNAVLKQAQVVNALTLQQGQQLLLENTQLRQLLATNARIPVKSVLGEILYDARDAFTRRIIVDRGLHHNISLGQPVIDALGVVGQVTRVFLMTSEVTLLTDKDQAIPVQVVRNGLRSVVYGRGQNATLELRMPSNADIQANDMLVTSGIDGVYPPGLAVARVTQVENKAASTFERIACVPIAGLDRHRHVLILQVDTHIQPRPPDDDIKPKKVNRKVTRDSAEPTAKPKEVTP